MRKFSSKDKLGIAIIAGVVGLVGVAAAFVYPTLTESSLDEIGCPTDRTVSHTLVLIDRTDVFTENQIILLRNLLNQFKQNLKLLQVREKLSIYVLDDKKPIKPIPSFSACRPESRKDVNELIANPDFAQEEFDRKFGMPLNDLLTGLTQGGKADQTHLMEMLREISLLDDFQQSVSKRRLIIFSDMLHHTKDFSMYSAGKRTRSFDEETENNPLYFDDLVRPRFDPGVSVALYILRRDTQKRAPPWSVVREFWYEYFTKNGFTLDKALACGERSYYDGCIYVEP